MLLSLSLSLDGRFSSAVSLSLSFSFRLAASGRRIGKDGASSSTSTLFGRRLNINPSAEVAGFQLERRDARGTDTEEKKLSPPARRRVQECERYISVRFATRVHASFSLAPHRDRNRTRFSSGRGDVSPALANRRNEDRITRGSPNSNYRGISGIARLVRRTEDNAVADLSS